MLVAFCDQRGRELDAALLEGGVVRIADHGVADLPLDLVERVDAGRRVTTIDGESGGASCGCFGHQGSPLKRSGGERRTILFGADGTCLAQARKFGVRIRQGPGELEVCAVIDVAELGQRQLGDRVRSVLVAVRLQRHLHPVHDGVDLGLRDAPLVGRASERAPELGAIERLPLAVALDDVERAALPALEGGEAATAGRALAAAAQSPCRPRRGGSPGRG